MKKFLSRLEVVICYLPSVIVDIIASLTSEESYKEARETTMRAFRRYWN